MLTTTGLITKETGATPATTVTGAVATGGATTLVIPALVAAPTGLALMATGPVAPAVTAPGGPTVMGFAATALISATPVEPETPDTAGVATLLLPPPPPPQAEIKIAINTGSEANGLSSV